MFKGSKRETLLFSIQKRLEAGQQPALRSSEAVALLEWAVECEDADQQTELLQLFRKLGGLELVRAALSDFD